MHKPAHAREQESAAAVEIQTPAVLVSRPVGALAQKAEHLSRKVERQELQIAEQIEREKLNKAILEHLRHVDLGVVIKALGGEPDHDDHRWHLGGEVISITGEKFYNHTRKQEGWGAIDLLIHAQNYSYREALGWLHHQVGTGVAVVAAARHALAIAESEPLPPFNAPKPDSARWQEVRAYLINDRALPSQWIDLLHDRSGLLYSDKRANAVFIQRNDQDEATGAYLQGTWQRSTFSGLAAGTRREGWFRMTLQRTEGRADPADARPVLILAGSPIGALSALDEMQRRTSPGGELGPVTVMATDGMGALPHQAIRQTLDQGGIVRVATADDQAGEHIWQTIQEGYPAEPGIVPYRYTGGRTSRPKD